MKLSWRTELPQWLILGGMFLLAASSWSRTPDRVPVHWGLQGQVDRYGGRFEGLLGIPLLALGIYAAMLLLPRVDPGRANYERFAGAYATTRIAVLTLMAAIYGIIHLWVRGIQVDVAAAVPFLVGAPFLVFGNILGRCGPTGSSASARPGRCRASSPGPGPIGRAAGSSSRWGWRSWRWGWCARPGPCGPRPG